MTPKFRPLRFAAALEQPTTPPHLVELKGWLRRSSFLCPLQRHSAGLTLAHLISPTSYVCTGAGGVLQVKGFVLFSGTNRENCTW